MRTVGVSSVTGEGMGDLEAAIREAKEEYFSVFLPMIQVGRRVKTRSREGKSPREGEERSRQSREADEPCEARHCYRERGNQRGNQGGNWGKVEWGEGSAGGRCEGAGRSGVRERGGGCGAKGVREPDAVRGRVAQSEEGKGVEGRVNGVHDCLFESISESINESMNQ